MSWSLFEGIGKHGFDLLPGLDRQEENEKNGNCGLDRTQARAVLVRLAVADRRGQEGWATNIARRDIALEEQPAAT